MHYNYTRSKLLKLFALGFLWFLLSVIISSFIFIIVARNNPGLGDVFIMKTQYLEKNIFLVNLYSAFLVFITLVTNTFLGAFVFSVTCLVGWVVLLLGNVLGSLTQVSQIRMQLNDSKLRERYLNKKSAQEKELQERQINRIIDNSADCYIRLSSTLKIMYLNTSAKMFLNKVTPITSFRGVYMTDILADFKSTNFEQILKEVFRNQSTKSAEIYLQKVKKWILFRAFYEDGNIGMFFSDITSKKDSKSGIDLGISLLRQLLDASIEPVALVDLNWKYLLTNPKWVRSFGLEEKTIQGVSMVEGIPMFQKNIAEYQKDLARGAGVKLPEFQTTINGTKEWIRFELKPYRNEDDKIAGFIVSAVFTTIARKRRKQAEKQRQTERKLAYHDMLTGLPNRQLFHDRLNESLTSSYRNLKKTALLFIDLDGFKAVNDNLGHDVGDRLLQDVSVRFQETVRGSDTVARLGGDEFTIILNNIDSEQDVATISSKIIKKVAEPFDYGEGIVAKVTASIGIAMYPKDGSNSVDLIHHADESMYKAKNNGKNNYVFYEKQGFDIEQAKITEEDIQKAISDNEFMLHYQGHFDAGKKKVYGVEALLRWNHPQYGLLRAGQFLPKFEQDDIMVNLGQFALGKACEQLKDWESQGQKGLMLSMNMSARELQDKTFVKRVAKMIKQYDITPNSLGFEISEKIILNNPQTIAEILKELKALGIVLIVEQLNKEGVSLNILKDNPIDMLKIDYSYLSGIGKDKEAEDVITNFIKTARAMGMEPAADCVETPEQEAFLIKNGCYKMQGYLFGRPTRPTKHFVVNQHVVNEGNPQARR